MYVCISGQSIRYLGFESEFGCTEDILINAIIGVASGAEWLEELIDNWFAVGWNTSLTSTLSWDMCANKIEIKNKFDWLKHEWVDSIEFRGLRRQI